MKVTIDLLTASQDGRSVNIQLTEPNVLTIGYLDKVTNDFIVSRRKL